WTAKYNVQFEKTKILNNYEIKYQIIQIDSLQNKTIKLGIDEISLKIHNILNSTTEDLDQFLKLNHQMLNGKIVASPMIMTVLDQVNQIELGSTIPFQEQTQFGTTTQWKFAGLKVKNTLTNVNNKLALKFS